jgi:hypothetical protein
MRGFGVLKRKAHGLTEWSSSGGRVMAARCGSRARSPNTAASRPVSGGGGGGA